MQDGGSVLWAEQSCVNSAAAPKCSLTSQVYGRLVSPACKSVSAETEGQSDPVRPGRVGTRRDSCPGSARHHPTRRSEYLPRIFAPGSPWSQKRTRSHLNRHNKGAGEREGEQPTASARDGLVIGQQSENARAHPLASFCSRGTPSPRALKWHSQGHRLLQDKCCSTPLS